MAARNVGKGGTECAYERHRRLTVTISHRLRQIFAASAIATLFPAIALQACSNDAGLSSDEQPTAPGVNSEPDNTVCMLNNCHSDEECGGCDNGRDTCLLDENRCVACDPVSGKGCDAGESCSPYGLCVPEGQICPADEHGEPTIGCNVDADCAACSPQHQVCNAGACTACTSADTSHCLASQICDDGKCAAKCPSSCNADADCNECGAPGSETHACNDNTCAECSDTYPCPEGLECQAGSCVPRCGIANSTLSGDCTADEDCKFCGDGNSDFVCKKPLNSNDPMDHGSCVPKADGCSDLGKNVAVLPAPWNQSTNLCSSDMDCAGQGIQYNVGKLIRDTLGKSSILGAEIKDANVNYEMGTCANIDLTESISCGVCVPCKVDSDCAPIQVSPLISQLFAGSPIATIAGTMLLDLLYGENDKQQLNFFCQGVAAGYGVCAPCSNPAQACGSNQGPPNPSQCSHSECSEGDKLTPSCSACATDVCNQDPYCCNTKWDKVCTDVAKTKSSCGC
jgi:hypothetical protein